MLNKLFYSLVEETGYRLYKKRFMPKGCDPYLDIKRLDKRDFKIIFDVGANIGQTAAVLRTHFSCASIHCFEPFSRSYQALVQNIAHDQRAKAYQLALGSKPGFSKISITEDSVANSLLPMDNAYYQYEDVEVETIDRILDKEQLFHIDLLKTDAEGYDLEVLKGATKAFENRKIRFVFTEATIRDEDRQRTNFFAIHDFLKNHGMNLYAIYDLYHLEQPIRINYFNALFVSESL
jgi:FkbM family methyltransferase